MSLSSGTKIGSYEVASAIGAGGMGEVYQAKDSKLGRDVALKVLPASFATDPERLARFRREAQVVASLNHPNIAQIYGFEDSGATHAIVMELVEGPTLADRILHGPMPVDEALAIARQIALGLEAAHEIGIIHRDLKPANIKVKEDGTVKVLDFGLAKALDPIGGSSPDVMNSPTLTARSTQVGTILGTAAYMAPEQAKGRTVDRRADIWAFGVVLFEMLAGERAFKGDDVSDVLAAVLRQEIDWKALPAGTPKKLRRVLERRLEREPKKRLRDIGDVWLELDSPDEPASIAVAAPPPPRASVFSRALPWVMAAVLAGAAIAWSAMRSVAPPSGGVMRTSTTLKDMRLFADVSQDGTRLVYTLAGIDNSSQGIALRMFDQFDGKIVLGTENGGFPLLSPDGQWIAFNDPSGFLKKVPITGGAASQLCACSLINGGTWGEDNTIIFSAGGVLKRVSADGGTPEAITSVDTAKGESGHIRPQFLPGGTQVLFTVATTDGPKFAVMELGKPGHRIIGRSGDNGKYVRSGHLVSARDQTLFAIPFDFKRLEVTGSEVPVVENVSETGPPGTSDYAVSAGGVLAYFVGTSTRGTTLAWLDRTGVTKPLPGQAQQL